MANRQVGSLKGSDLAPILQKLKRVNEGVARAFPGESTERQPVHTVYGGAHLFRADSAKKLGAVALAALDEYAPDPATLASALALLARASTPLLVRARVSSRSCGASRSRTSASTSRTATATAPTRKKTVTLARWPRKLPPATPLPTLPAFIGIRIKPLSKELHGRSLRTLDIFVTTLVRKAGTLPPNFVVTVPKLMAPGQVTAVAATCAALEKRLKLKAGSLKLELMIETPQSILAADGTSALRPLIAAGEGRITGAHFGTYDYTALCGITAAWQHMRHQVCDFAKHMMQVALAQSGVRLSDGATNIMPVPDPPPAVAERPDHRAAAGERRGRPPRLEDALRRRDAFAGEWLLPGLGPASGAAGDALRGRLYASSSPRCQPPPRACATSWTRPRRRRSSATCSTTRRRGRGC